MKIHREKLQIRSDGEFHVVDITADAEKAILTSGIQEGFLIVYTPHTTCAVLVNEKESGLLADLQNTLGRLIPSDLAYQHDDFDVRTENLHPGETENAHAHLRQMLSAKTSECVLVSEGALMLGTWQRIMVLEFDRAREREILIQVCGS